MPAGMETSPSRMPRVKKGRSASRTAPSPTGMVKTTVQPKMAETMMPENRPITGSAARSMAIW